MKTQFNSRSLAYAALLAVSVVACTEVAPVAPEDNTTLDRIMGPGALPTYRPIEDFVLAQGSTIVLGEPATYLRRGALAWFDQDRNRTASVDYAGAIRKAFLSYEPSEELQNWTEPRFAGRVREQLLPDGSARVTVELYSEDVSSYVTVGPGALGEKVIFGSRVGIAEKGAALGWAKLVVNFRNPAVGAPLPDLWQLIYAPAPRQQFESLSFHAEAEAVDAETGLVRRCIIDQASYFTWMPRLAPETIPVTIRFEGAVEEDPPPVAES